MRTELFDQVKDTIIKFGEFLSKAEGFSVEADITGLLTQVSEPFSFFFCGEFNSGKSSLLNALSAETLAQTGILPTTKAVSALKSKNYPLLVFVDSPGTNSLLTEQDQITARFLQRADAVIFVTSVERPLSHSEVSFVAQVRDVWKRPIVVVLNKADLLSAAEAGSVEQYVQQGLEQQLHFETRVWAVSARNGLGIGDLRQYLLRFLEQSEVLKLKAPLSALLVFERKLADQFKGALSVNFERKRVYERILSRVNRRRSEAGLIFDGFGERARRPFQELTLVLNRLVDEELGIVKVLRTRLLRGKEQLSADVHAALDEVHFEEKIAQVVDEAANKLTLYRELMVSDVEEYLEAFREKLSHEIRLPAFKREGLEVKKLADELRKAAEKGLNRFLAFGGAAAVSGIGAKIAAVGAFEVTGVVLMLALAAFSLRAFPRERRRIKSQISTSFAVLADGFALQLKEAIQSYLAQALSELEKIFAPDLSKVQQEEGRINALNEELKLIKVGIVDLEKRIAA